MNISNGCNDCGLSPKSMFVFKLQPIVKTVILCEKQNVAKRSSYKFSCHGAIRLDTDYNHGDYGSEKQCPVFLQVTIKREYCHYRGAEPADERGRNAEGVFYNSINFGRSS